MSASPPGGLERVENLGNEAYCGTDFVTAAGWPATALGKLFLRLRARHDFTGQFPDISLEELFRQFRRIDRITPGLGRILRL